MTEKLGSTYEYGPLTEEQKMIADAAYDDLTAALCDVDEELGMMFLEEMPITVKDVKSALRRAVIANQIVPVAGGSAFKNKGVQALLDAVVDYLPEPARYSAADRSRRG